MPRWQLQLRGLRPCTFYVPLATHLSFVASGSPMRLCGFFHDTARWILSCVAICPLDGRDPLPHSLDSRKAVTESHRQWLPQMTPTKIILQKIFSYMKME